MLQPQQGVLATMATEICVAESRGTHIVAFGEVADGGRGAHGGQAARVAVQQEREGGDASRFPDLCGESQGELYVAAITANAWQP